MGALTIQFLVRGATLDDAYARVSAFETYPDHSDAVIGVEVIERSATAVITSWEVQFRRGILRWTERAAFDDVGSMIRFAAVEGDIDEFRGHWRVGAGDGGAVIEFSVEFDIGIPTLEHILDPIAEGTLYDNLQSIVTGLFGPVEVISATGSTRTWDF